MCIFDVFYFNLLKICRQVRNIDVIMVMREFNKIFQLNFRTRNCEILISNCQPILLIPRADLDLTFGGHMYKCLDCPFYTAPAHPSFGNLEDNTIFYFQFRIPTLPLYTIDKF